MTQKFVMGAPIYRQEQELNRQGIPLSRQTMSNWVLKASETYLTPVYEQLCRELVKRDVLHCDETTLQVLHEPGKAPESKSYMWLYRTSGDTDKPVVMNTSRAGERSIRRSSSRISRATSIRTAMRSTTDSRRALRLWAVMHTFAVSLTKP